MEENAECEAFLQGAVAGIVSAAFKASTQQTWAQLETEKIQTEREINKPNQ